MKTYYVFDTNAIKVGKKYTIFNDFSANKRVKNLREKIEKNDLLEKYGIIIPRIVLEELKEQQINEFNEEFKRLKQSYNKIESLNFIDINRVEEINYSRMINKWVDNYIKLNHIEVLEICSEEKFNKIVSRALAKKAPFKGASGESDKGFKDVLIWESLLSFSAVNKGIYIFVTTDNDFSEVLSSEFLEETNNEISFVTVTDFDKNSNKLDLEINNISQLRKFKNVKEEFLFIKEEFIKDLKHECLSNVKVFGNIFINPVIDFEDINLTIGESDDIYKISIYSKIILEDVGLYYELNLRLYFELIYQSYIEEIRLIEVIAEQLNGRIVEEFSINDFVKNYENPIDDVEELTIDDDFLDISIRKVDNENNGTYMPNILNITMVESIIKKQEVEVKTNSKEIVNTVEKFAYLDWYAFPNKVSLIKTELKKLFRKNREKNEIINKLTNEVVDYAKKKYEESSSTNL